MTIIGWLKHQGPSPEIADVAEQAREANADALRVLRRCIDRSAANIAQAEKEELGHVRRFRGQHGGDH